jgi:hypothetical protein
MQVAPAYAHVHHFQENIFIADFRYRNVPHLYRAFLRSKVYDCR